MGIGYRAAVYRLSLREVFPVDLENLGGWCYVCARRDRPVGVEVLNARGDRQDGRTVPMCARCRPTFAFDVQRTSPDSASDSHTASGSKA